MHFLEGFPECLPDEVAGKWQRTVDTIAELLGVPAGLIMHVRDEKIEVAVASSGGRHPYRVGDSEHLAGSGLYCETVVCTEDRLLVADALADEQWRDNPDVKFGMIAYLGFPIHWPDGRPFGTLCALDSKSNHFGQIFERLLIQFRDLIEQDLAMLSGGLSFAQRLTQEREEARNAASAARAELATATKFSVIGELAGSIIHEIYQPLTSMRLRADAALRWLDRDPPRRDEAICSIEALRVSIDETVELVENLRARARRAPAAVKSLELNEIVSKVVALARRDLRSMGVHCELHLDMNGTCLQGDRLQIEQLVMNLVQNAGRALQRVSDRSRRVRVTTRAGAEGWTLVVEDNGPGIEPSIAGMIFEPLFTTEETGLGLGLSICKSIVEGHHGTISVEERDTGPGARFRIVLPIEN
jgi:signal transduction histidine kinase